MDQHCFVLDLKQDENLIKEYIRHHQQVWPEIIAGIKTVGILDMKIYYWKDRLMMMVMAPDGFDIHMALSKLSEMPRQQEWEALMWNYQKQIVEGKKWVKMDCIFALNV